MNLVILNSITFNRDFAICFSFCPVEGVNKWDTGFGSVLRNLDLRFYLTVILLLLQSAQGELF